MATYVLIDRPPYVRYEGIHGVQGQGRNLPPSGEGYLAGDFPDGITKIEGVPGSATVRVLYRPGPGLPGDGVVIAEVQSNPDGTWRVDGLNTALRYDVVCRHGGYNDSILSNVTPATEL